MKIAIIGGAGVRVPLLVNGLVRSDLPIDEIALFDIDRERQETISALASRFADRALRVAATPEAAIEGADYVFTSIRVGGVERRARDERAALSLGLVGQETVGPCGFAMAMRTIPPMLAYARIVEKHAPRAWMINFTNPVGIVTQALTAQTDARVIGICDTPTELFEEIAHALGIPSSDCTFDYFGLNHLGWVREVFHQGQPQLERLWSRPDQLRSLYRAPLFDPDYLCGLKLLPTEYVFYYERPADAVANMQRAGHGRGMVVEALNRQLFRDLSEASNDPVRVYEQYLAARDSGYMQIESGGRNAPVRSPWATLTGYDKIALHTVRAIHFDTGAVIPLNVLNGSTIDGLERDDVVEVPCVVGSAGAQPSRVGAIPSSVAGLVRRVKTYERLTVGAALSGKRQDAIDALASNPLVPTRSLAEQLVARLLTA